MRKPYPTDLSDAQWAYLEGHLPTPEHDGRPRVHSLREILDAVFYVVRSGCAWRLLPPRVPTLEDRLPLLPLLALGWNLGEDARCPAQACAGPLQEEPPAQRRHRRQSVKTTGVGGEERGYDGGKKVEGRKRHPMVDTRGSVLKARLHSAQIQDRDGIKPLLEIATWDRLPRRLSHLWMDAAYTGEDKGADWAHKVLGWTAEILRRPPKMAPEEVLMTWVREWAKEGIAIEREKLPSAKGPRAFLPKRWVVERTFSWLGQSRRLSKDYERLPESGEAFIHVAMSRLMVRRLARS
jgi:putative transposase